MIETIQFKRGLEANLPRLADGEPAFCEDTQNVYIGSSSGNKLVFSGSLTDYLNKLGDLTQLQTTDKDTLVHAINNNSVSLADIVTVKNSADLINVLTSANVNNSIINLKANITFDISSALTTSGAVPLTNAQNIVINGNGATIDGGILFSGSFAKNIIFKDCNFVTSKNVDLVKFTCEMDNVTFERCKLNQNSLTYGSLDAGLIYFNSSNYSIYGLTVKNCVFSSNANTNFKVGIKLHNSGSATANNIKISECDFSQFNGFGIESNCGNVVKIDKCDFYQCDHAASGSAGISMVSGYDVSITNSTFRQNAWGIELTGQRLTVENCYFEGTTNKWNIVTDGNSSDIFIKSCTFYDGVIGTSGSSITITNFIIENNCKFYATASIEMGSPVNGVIVDGNHFKGTGQFYWYSVNVLLTGVIIKNNTVDTTGMSNTQYTFRFNPSQNKDEVIPIHNEILGNFLLCDIRKDETESLSKSHNRIGGSVYTNKVIGSITSTQKGFTLTIDKNSNGGIPQGTIEIRASMYNSNNTAKYGKYILSIGTYSVASGGVTPISIVNTNFGDLTTTTTDDGQGHIQIGVIFGTNTNITDTLYLVLDFEGFNNNRMVYRSFTGIAKP